jgi:hypothetical protein
LLSLTSSVIMGTLDPYTDPFLWSTMGEPRGDRASPPLLPANNSNYSEVGTREKYDGAKRPQRRPLASSILVRKKMGNKDYKGEASILFVLYCYTEVQYLFAKEH